MSLIMQDTEIYPMINVNNKQDSQTMGNYMLFDIVI